MISNKKVLALIPARKGSKRLLNKNTRPLNNKPLISYTIEEALKSKYINNIIVSTDDKEVKKIARNYKVYDYNRPTQLAGDDTPMEQVIEFVKKQLPIDYKPDIYVLLLPTAPLRKASHIDKCIEMLDRNDFDSVVSVKELAPHVYRPNSGVYVFKDKMFTDNMGMLLMQKEESVDIDTLYDLMLAQLLINEEEYGK